MNDHQILPYIGVGDLRFDMSPEDVRKVLGVADSSFDDEESGTIIEYRQDNALQTAYERNKKRLVLVSMYAPIAGIRVDDQPLLWSESEAWYNYLRETDPTARQTVGVSVFFKYGIATAGLLSAEQGDKSVTAFARGQWDESDRTLKPLA